MFIRHLLHLYCFCWAIYITSDILWCMSQLKRILSLFNCLHLTVLGMVCVIFCINQCNFCLQRAWKPWKMKETRKDLIEHDSTLIIVSQSLKLKKTVQKYPNCPVDILQWSNINTEKFKLKFENCQLNCDHVSLISA